MASVTYLKEFASTGSFYMSTYVRSSFMAKMLSLFNIACNYRTMHSYINAFHLPREIYLTQYSNPWLYWSMDTIFLNSNYDIGYFIKFCLIRLDIMKKKCVYVSSISCKDQYMRWDIIFYFCYPVWIISSSTSACKQLNKAFKCAQLNGYNRTLFMKP